MSKTANGKKRTVQVCAGEIATRYRFLKASTGKLNRLSRISRHTRKQPTLFSSAVGTSLWEFLHYSFLLAGCLPVFRL